MVGQNITLTHNLNTNEVSVEITGKATVNGGIHQKHLGLTDYTIGWSKTYGGTNYDEGRSVVQTGDGGYAIAGDTDSFGAGGGDVYLVKTDSAGTMLWNKTYGGTSSDTAYSVVQTSDGGYAIAGYTQSFGAGSSDVYLVKTDSAGSMLWNKTYGGTSNDIGYSLVQTGDGGYAIAGQTYSGAGNDDVYLVKTDSAGTMLWNKTYGGTSPNYGYSVVQTGDGGYAIAGLTYSFGVGNWEVYLVKTDVGLGLAWTDSTANTITLYRGLTDAYWNYVRVRLWKIP